MGHRPPRSAAPRKPPPLPPPAPTRLLPLRPVDACGLPLSEFPAVRALQETNIRKHGAAAVERGAGAEELFPGMRLEAQWWSLASLPLAAWGVLAQEPALIMSASCWGISLLKAGSWTLSD